jgi:hypothetical protein
MDLKVLRSSNYKECMYDDRGKCFQKINFLRLLESSNDQSGLASVDFAKLIDLVVKDPLRTNDLVLCWPWNKPPDPLILPDSPIPPDPPTASAFVERGFVRVCIVLL